jgi:hypothetical protein
MTEPMCLIVVPLPPGKNPFAVQLNIVIYIYIYKCNCQFDRVVFGAVKLRK